MFVSAVIRPPVWWVKMIPVLICALISLSVAENNDLDTLFPELEHSRTIYVTGEYLYIYMCVCECVFLWCSDNVAQSLEALSGVLLWVSFTTLTLQCHLFPPFISLFCRCGSVITLLCGDLKLSEIELSHQDLQMKTLFEHVRISNVAR